MIYIVALVSILLGAFAQYFLKIGMASVNLDKPVILIVKNGISNPLLWLGLFCYGLSMIFWLIVLSRMDLSKAYPMVSLGYIFTLILGYFLLGEDLNFNKILGVGLIVGGVLCIARS